MFVDPLAEQTMTRYQYVSNNPIMRIDPTGMNDHDYEKNKETGRLTIRKGSVDNPEYDRVFDSEGNSIKVDKGVIKDENRGIKASGTSSSGKQINTTYDYYEFKDKDKAYEFYEFMYNQHTNYVEFSLMDLTHGNGQNSYTIGTIGNEGSEGAWSMVFGKLYDKDKNIKMNILRHNHPGGGLEPSDGDIDAIDNFMNRYPNQTPQFFIDCNECKWNNKTNAPDPKSSVRYTN